MRCELKKGGMETVKKMIAVRGEEGESTRNAMGEGGKNKCRNYELRILIFNVLSHHTDSRGIRENEKGKAWEPRNKKEDKAKIVET
jgi:hypothetical protein